MSGILRATRAQQKRRAGQSCGCASSSALGLLLLALSREASAQLSAALWPSAAFAPEAAAARATAPAATLAGLAVGANFSSVRLTGTVTPALDDAALNFSAASDGGVRLWVDDFLLIDAGGLHEDSGAATAAGRAAFQTISVVGGVPLAFKLEYSRWASPASGAPPSLELTWEGASTPRAVVPPSAFSPASSAAQLQRAALRDRLESPVSCPWQTYYRRSATAHTLAPTGLVLHATIVDANASRVMGDIIVQRGGGPYLARAGAHSRNGSDYTSFSVWDWAGLDCNVSMETTVEPGSLQLQFLAASTGTDCGRLLLLVHPLFFPERVGFPAADPGGGGGFVVKVPGFPAVAAAPAGAAPVPLNASVAPSGGVPYFAVPLLDGAVVGYCAQAGPATLTCPPVSEMAAGIAAARMRAAAASERYGALAETYEGIASSILWSTVWAVQEGVVGIVSRNPNWGGNSEFTGDYVLFEWDSYFIALQASVEEGTLRDIGLSTLLQITLARTPRGMIPNWKSGNKSSYDRTENAVGALVSRRILEMLPSDLRSWVLELLFPPLLSWCDWVWRARMALGGVLAGEPLFVLGSDPSSPHDNGDGNIQGARYESMDNSAQYDAPPVAFNDSTYQITQYDVSPTALFISEAQALIALAPEAGRADVVPTLRSRLNATAAALNANLWQDDVPPSGAYANRLFSGAANARLAPPSVYPLLSASASDAQALALGQLLASPLGFCVNASHSPGTSAAPTGLLTRWLGRSSQLSTGCVSEACSSAALLYGKASFEAVEASVPLASGAAPPFAGAVALYTFVSAALGNATALATAPPDANFSLVRQEAWCFSPSSPPTPSMGFRPWPLTNLTLWTLTAPPRDFRTCGTAACEAGAAAAGYSRVGGEAAVMCLAFDASAPATLPCVVPVPSVARADASFLEQNYWRGRGWAPQALLTYLALLRYDHLAPLREARRDLAELGQSVFLRELRAFGHFAENYNGMTGFSQDSGDADPAYAWGGCYGLMAVLEGGFGSDEN